MADFGQHGLSIPWRPGQATAMSERPTESCMRIGSARHHDRSRRGAGVRLGGPTRQDESVPRTSAAVRIAALAAGTPA